MFSAFFKAYFLFLIGFANGCIVFWRPLFDPSGRQRSTGRQERYVRNKVPAPRIRSQPHQSKFGNPKQQSQKKVIGTGTPQFKANNNQLQVRKSKNRIIKKSVPASYKVVFRIRKLG